MRYADDGGADPTDHLVATGTFLAQLQAAERFLRRNLAGAYPLEVFREAVVNALIHRDYAIGWGEVSIRLLGDRIEVASPGLLIGGLSLEELGRGPIDHPPRRNPSLVNLFFAQTRGRPGGELYLERAGTGLNRMRERLAERGLPAPEFRQDEQRLLFTVGLRGVPLGRAAPAVPSAGLNPRQRELVEQMAAGESISAGDYRARFRVSRATATADLAALTAGGWLVPRGAGPGRRYERAGTTGPGGSPTTVD